MQIFIDESGSFTGYGGETLSVVGALCIPDGSMKKITDRYLRLRPSLPKQSDEVKGRLLSENDLNKVISILCPNRAIFEVTAIDVGTHTESGVSYRDQLATDTEGRIGRFNEKAQNELRQHIIQIRRTPAPLFLQAIVTMDVLETVVRHIPLYFAQRQPRELSSFKWIVDGKDLTTTDWERWWSTYIQGVLAARSIANPGPALTGADYSHFSPYQIAAGDRESGTDLKLLFSDFRFSADPEPGLELVDILTNAIRRALIGNLKKSGWEHLPRLMIHRREHYVGLMRLHGASSEPIDPKYKRVVQHFMTGGKNMVAPHFLKLADKEP